MSKRSIIIIGTVLVVATIIAGVYFFADPAAAPQDPINNQPAGNTVIEDRKITDNTKPFDIGITYPHISGENDFNRKVDAMVNSHLEEFKRSALENDAAVKATDPESYAKYPRTYGLNISYIHNKPSANVVSVVFQIYVDTGGAHPNGYFTSLNYDTAKDKELALSDVFSGQANYVKKISDYAKQELAKQAVEKAGSAEGFWIDDGASPKEDNFSVFLLGKDAITFYFSPYQVGPYVAGSFEVHMPR